MCASTWFNMILGLKTTLGATTPSRDVTTSDDVSAARAAFDAGRRCDDADDDRWNWPLLPGTCLRQLACTLHEHRGARCARALGATAEHSGMTRGMKWPLAHEKDRVDELAQTFVLEPNLLRL